MLKKITKEEFCSKIICSLIDGDEFYYNTIYDSYIIINNDKEIMNDCVFYLVFKNKVHHNEIGPAVIGDNFEYKKYYLNGIVYKINIFKEYTKHILCDIYNDFCKQKCFLE